MKILAKYTDYVDIFSFNLAIELLKNSGINKYIIKLIEDKYPSYGFHNILSSIESGNLKINVKTSLKTGFI